MLKSHIQAIKVLKAASPLGDPHDVRDLPPKRYSGPKSMVEPKVRRVTKEQSETFSFDNAP